MSLRRTFGRPGPLHFLVAAGVGVGTGYYTFEPAVRKHFEKQGQHGLTAEPKSDTGVVPAHEGVTSILAGPQDKGST